MARGGARPGAGRPPGGKSPHRRDLSAKALQILGSPMPKGFAEAYQSRQPLDVLLTSMRSHEAYSDALIEQIQTARADGDITPDDFHLLFTEAVRHRSLAQKAAIAAAPYIHPCAEAATEEPPAPDALDITPNGIDRTVGNVFQAIDRFRSKKAS